MRVGAIGDQYPWPAQDFQRIEWRRLLDQAGDALGGGDQLRGALAVHLQRFAGAVFGEAQGAFDFATREALAQRFAHRSFEVAESIRQAQMRLQVAVIDRAQLPAQGAVDHSLFGAGEGSHAVNHGANLSESRSWRACHEWRPES
ncbi:hypothetical protein D9M68_777580 [compost metagenome]